MDSLPTNTAISRVAVPDVAALPQDMQDMIAKVQEKSGFVPNIFLALAHRPAEFRAFFAYHDALMDKDEGLSKAEREMIVVATSSANQCQYCVVAHGAILRIRARDPLIADQVAINWRKAPLSARHRAMLDYAELVALDAAGPAAPRTVKTLPARFDATGLEVRQFFATSDDGTRIPYFVVRRRDVDAGPTLLYGYGGFENSLTPGYLSIAGLSWIERGGIYVIANIRGGGEYGPHWHTQTQKAGRHKVYEDFSSVAKDLVTQGLTTPAQLGAQGGSNGGLLMGVSFNQHPELWRAVSIAVRSAAKGFRRRIFHGSFGQLPLRNG